MFSVAGPVIVFGTVASVIVGILYACLQFESVMALKRYTFLLTGYYIKIIFIARYFYFKLMEKFIIFSYALLIISE